LFVRQAVLGTSLDSAGFNQREHAAIEEHQRSRG